MNFLDYILNKKKYYAIFLRKEQNSLSRVRKKRFLPTAKDIKYKKKQYPLNTEFPTYIRGMKLFYFIDYDTKEQYNFENKESTISLETIDDLVGRNIFAQITTNLEGTAFKTTIFNIVIGLVIGALTGFLISAFMFGGIS